MHHSLTPGTTRINHGLFSSFRQLTASDINFAIVRPLVFKYAKLDNLSVVYACFVVRSHFLSEAANNLAYSGVNLSRANLCEIMAIKLLNNFAANRLALVCALTASWSPLAGAPPQVVNEVQDIVGDDGVHDPQCALEVRTSIPFILSLNSVRFRWQLGPNQRCF